MSIWRGMRAIGAGLLGSHPESAACRHTLGLGAVWCGIYPREDRVEEFRKFFSLPSNIIPLALVPIAIPERRRAKRRGLGQIGCTGTSGRIIFSASLESREKIYIPD
jgi:hypothetical protein